MHRQVGSALVVVAMTSACGGGDDRLPTTPPTRVEMVTNEGFQNAGAVAASPDGETFYIAAYDMEGQPTIFALDVASGELQPLHSGPPLLYPSDLATSCDGSTLFVADLAIGAADSEVGDAEAPRSDAGALYTLATSGGAPVALAATGMERAAGVVVSVDCGTLYVSGWSSSDLPAVFTVDVAGGAARVLHEGAPLVSPTGIHVDADEVAWVMDHGAVGQSGQGALFAIDAEGNVSEVASDLAMGRHGGVSLTPGGTTAVIPTVDATGMGQLVTANTVSGETAIVPAPEIVSPTGTAAAKDAPVMVVAGENSIHIATFE